MSRLRIALLLGLHVLHAGCGGAGEGGRELSGRRVRAVATTSIIADLVREIGGERVEVTGLMGPGVDPHLYRASEGDVRRMSQADVIFYNGLHLEGRMAELFEQMEARGLRTVAIASGLEPGQRINSSAFAGAFDPHIWMDVSLWREGIPVVVQALAGIDPAGEASYRAQGEAYSARLERLDTELRHEASRLLPERRILVTAHDAFSYFGRAYDFEVRGLQGISTVAEPGTADVQELARFVVEHRIPAIFVESSISPRSLEAVLSAVRARGSVVRIGGDLYSDALGGEGSGASTYEGMMRHNMETIVTALLGEER